MARMITQKILLPLGLLLLGACAATGEPDRPRAGAVAATCADKAQCELYWKRAQDWVTQHSTRQVVSNTDWMIVTAAPGSLDASPTFEVKRWPGPKDSGEIRFSAFCSTFLPCNPQEAQSLEAFQRFVTAP